MALLHSNPEASPGQLYAQASLRRQAGVADERSPLVAHEGVAPPEDGGGIEGLEVLLESLVALLLLLKAMAHGLN
jgi:hypothetical protein